MCGGFEIEDRLDEATVCAPVSSFCLNYVVGPPNVQLELGIQSIEKVVCSIFSRTQVFRDATKRSHLSTILQSVKVKAHEALFFDDETANIKGTLSKYKL